MKKIYYLRIDAVERLLALEENLDPESVTGIMKIAKICGMLPALETLESKQRVKSLSFAFKNTINQLEQEIEDKNKGKIK